VKDPNNAEAHSVAHLLSKTAASTRALFSRACCCRSATSLIIRCPSSTRFEVWTPFCHTLMTLHLLPINLD